MEGLNEKSVREVKYKKKQYDVLLRFKGKELWNVIHGMNTIIRDNKLAEDQQT